MKKRKKTLTFFSVFFFSAGEYARRMEHMAVDMRCGFYVKFEALSFSLMRQKLVRVCVCVYYVERLFRATQQDG